MKGPVSLGRREERNRAKATEVAGAGNVINQLEVAPPKS